MTDVTAPVDVEGRKFLLVKRGLYYGPNNSGYTGFKSRAGRYPESDADSASGVTAVHEDEAHDIAPNCYDDIVRAEFAKQATTIKQLEQRVGDVTAQEVGEILGCPPGVRVDRYIQHARKAVARYGALARVAKAAQDYFSEHQEDGEGVPQPQLSEMLAALDQLDLVDAIDAALATPSLLEKPL